MIQNSLLSKFNLKNKVAIITGASKGIGLEMALGLLESGAKVVISSRDQSALDSIVAQFPEYKHKLYGFACHVGSEAEINQLVDYTIKTLGRIDILINNAATNPVFGPIEDLQLDLFDKMMKTNVKGPLILSNLVFPFMKSQGKGSIIHISSVEGIKPSEGLSYYSINKAALLMLGKSQAKEWGKYNVRVNVICPGLIKTKFSASIWENEHMLKHWTEKIPLRRMAEPDELAGLALFLASDASSYCTGMHFTADGGYLIS